MESEATNSFVTENKSLLQDEILGLIVNTSRAIAAAQREIKMNGVNVRNRDTYPIANFYYYFNNLYLLTRDLIKDGELRRDINRWLNTDFHYTTNSSKVIEMFTCGMSLFNRLDAYLYQIGIKDTNKTHSTRFPFAYYARLLDE